MSTHQAKRLASLGERLDAHRKTQLAQHPELTMTGMYNVLEKLRANQPLETAAEHEIYERGLVGILKKLHDDLDSAALDAYGWSDLDEPAATGERRAELDEAILERLVHLNHERAKEEAQGHIRWLRPDYQNPSGTVVQTSTSLGIPAASTKPAKKQAKPVWPKEAAQRAQAVRAALIQLARPVAVQEVAATFKGAPRKQVAELLDVLDALGQCSRDDLGLYYIA